MKDLEKKLFLSTATLYYFSITLFLELHVHKDIARKVIYRASLVAGSKMKVERKNNRLSLSSQDQSNVLSLCYFLILISVYL